MFCDENSSPEGVLIGKSNCIIPASLVNTPRKVIHKKNRASVELALLLMKERHQAVALAYQT